jgi:hypothetical protein
MSSANDKLVWDASVGAVSYNVSAGPLPVANVVGTEITISALVGSYQGSLGNITIGVTAVDADGRESAPTELTGVTLDVTPDAPANVTIVPI